MVKNLKVKAAISVLVTGAAVSAPAWAVGYQFGPVEANIDSIITIGGAWRMSERDPTLIGKSNLQPGLCTARRSDGTLGNMEGHSGEPGGTPGNVGGTCNASNNRAVNQAYVNEPGFFSPNGDNGNLNYERYEMVNATAKYDLDVTLRWQNFDAAVSGVYFFDNVNTDFLERHPDTTLQPAFSPRTEGVENRVGNHFDLYDSYVTWNAPFFGERTLTLRAGNQKINWGESTFLALGSINSINPPDGNKLRLPGLQIKEIFQTVGMVTLSTDIIENLSTELFYQYDWRPARPDAAGSFFSTSDIAGGGTYAMLSFGKAPEDPTNSYIPRDNPNDPIGLLSNAGRTIFVTPSKLPEDGGQYGIAIRYLADWLNNGTEIGFYHENYHSRLPLVSAFAAQATCIGENTTNLIQVLAVDCGVGGGIGRLAGPQVVASLAAQGVTLPAPIATLLSNANPGLAREPLPVDTASVFLDYPEDIKLYGISFNTSLGDWAWSGEVAYRPNDPLQISASDLVLAAVNPAFPRYSFAVPGVGNLPNRRNAAPDYISRYRGKDPNDPNSRIQPGEYIPGFERFSTYNIGTTFINTIGGDNFLKASQILTVLEFGATHIADLPELRELQLNGPGADTHYSTGADGTGPGGEEDSFRPEDEVFASGDGSPLNPGCSDDFTACRQNPTHQRDGWATDWSYGYRAVAAIRYQDAIMGVNLEPIIGVFHDVYGYSAGPAANYVQGRVQGIYGLRFDYLSQWSGEIRYTSFGGGREHNQLRDRDNLFLFVGYSF